MAVAVSDPILEPMSDNRAGTLALWSIAAVGTAVWLTQVIRLLSSGHMLLGTDSYAAPWGITVANIVHLIGISHVGIAVSATVRVLGLERFRGIARLAEMVTLVMLVTAVVNIALDVGRPDRFLIDTLLHGRWHAPMVWSMTVIFLYLITSVAYLYLSMRRDLWWLSRNANRRRWLYGALTLGYRDTAGMRRRHERTLFWLALALVPIMVSVHSVYGLFFGLLSARPGWYNPLQAPAFVLAAIVSGFSAIIVIAALVRRAYSWGELLPDRLFKTFGSFLAFVVFLYLYFMVSEHLTAQFAAPAADRAVSDALLFGRFSTLFWITTLVGLVAPLLGLLVQAVRPGFVHVGLTAGAALLVNLAMWAKRFLIVIPSQAQPHLPLPRPVAPYAPTAVEMVVTFGSYFLALLLFLALMRVIPAVELAIPTAPEPHTGRESVVSARSVVLLATTVAGLLLIAWGVITRDLDLAPVKWMTGLALLVAVPLERCLIPDPPAASTQRSDTP
jgi:molybdopterin-containing oxidoreductase family membrane subunit